MHIYSHRHTHPTAPRACCRCDLCSSPSVAPKPALTCPRSMHMCNASTQRAESPALLNLVELVGYVLPVLEIHLNQCRSGFFGVGGSSQSPACHAPASTWCPSGPGEAEQDKQPHGQELNRSCWATCSRGWRPKKQPDLGADYCMTRMHSSMCKGVS